MIEFLRDRARADPGRPAVVTDQVSLTYRQLLDRAHSAAAGLRARGIARVGIADFEAPIVVPLLAGAALAGVEACVYPPDDAAALVALANRFDHGVLVSDRDDLDGVDVVRPGALLSSAALSSAPPPGRTPRPHLVLTTGTTGAPRGVRHDWDRIVQAARRVKPEPAARWLLAYGLHQFAGLQVLVHVFAAGATLVAPAPRRPREGLAAMRVHAVDHASATPTYWRFLLAEMRSDRGPVPGLKQITLGGEAIPGPLLDDLREAFPAAEVSQIYAASEFGASSSIRDGRPGLPTGLLERGDDADVALKVVDGELWVRSRIGMLGYYGEEPVDAAGWRATGDLVELDGDRIRFRGRTSEIINVGGVKVHPLPIEERIAAVAGVDVARVYARPNAMTGSIVAVEVVVQQDVDTDRVDLAIREACADLPAAARPRSIRFVDVLVTQGEKIVRSVSGER